MFRVNRINTQDNPRVEKKGFMIARPFSLFYNAFNMEVIHACFGFF